MPIPLATHGAGTQKAERALRAGELTPRHLRAGKIFDEFAAIAASRVTRDGFRRPALRSLRRLGKFRGPPRAPMRLARSRFGIFAMKVTVERSVLLKALGHVHRIVEKRNTIPILSNVLIEASDGQVALKSTDLDLEATEQVGADVVQAGATTVAAHVIYDIVRKLAEGAQVSLEMAGDTGQLLLRSGRSRFSLQALPASDFPDLTLGEFPHSFTLPAAELKRLIDNSQFAISTEETRYYLNGIFLHTADVGGSSTGSGAMLRAVATDGHRLARVETPAPQGSVGMPGVIAPRKAVGEVLKLLEDSAKEVKIEISTAKARFNFGDVVLTTKLIDGTFPDYQRVIPIGNDKRLVVDKEPFEKAVDRVSTLSSERGRAIKLSIADNKMTLSVNNPDSGSASEEIEVDYDSAPIDIGFNARYLLDILDQLSGDTALIKLADPGSPTLIQDRDGASALYVLMPLRV
jgi:DNA polymerase-3 subunit beta